LPGLREASHDAHRQRPADARGVAEKRDRDGGVSAELLDRRDLDVRARRDEIRAGVGQDGRQSRIADAEAGGVRWGSGLASPLDARRDYGWQPPVAALRRGAAFVLHRAFPARGRIQSHKAMTHESARHQPATTSEG
jgi:hypothetical protein